MAKLETVSTKAPIVEKSSEPVTRPRATAASILGLFAKTTKPPTPLSKEQLEAKRAEEIRQADARASALKQMARQFGCVSVADLNLSSRRPAC